jgi:hypothetical protein
MLDNHLTDEEVQNYVLDRDSIETRVSVHVQRCEACKARVETYQLLFTALGEQPAPAFEFNLSELVMAKLPSPEARTSRDTIFVYLLSISSILLMAIALYIFRKDIIELVPDPTPLLGYLIIPAVITVLVLSCIDMYKNYQNKMNSLDFH